MPVCVLIAFEVGLQPKLVAGAPEMQLQGIVRSAGHGT